MTTINAGGASLQGSKFSRPEFVPRVRTVCSASPVGKQNIAPGDRNCLLSRGIRHEG